VLRVAIPQLEDAGQDGAHRGEVQRFLAFVETLQVVSKVLARLFRETANDFLRVPEPADAGLRSRAGHGQSYIETCITSRVWSRGLRVEAGGVRGGSAASRTLHRNREGRGTLQIGSGLESTLV